MFKYVYCFVDNIVKVCGGRKREGEGGRERGREREREREREKVTSSVTYPSGPFTSLF